MAARQRPVATASVDIAGDTVPLTVTWHPRARRLTLRADPRTGGARLTVPDHVDLDQAVAFLRRHASWLQRERARFADPVPFADGARVPLRGAPHLVRHRGGNGRRIAAGAEDGAPVIWVSGDRDMLAIRLKRWLMSEARADLRRAVDRHGRHFRVTPGRIALRDQRTRWGSCSSGATLSFSWRLVMAPANVLDYVAAHEVAHLIEMNHSARFWKLVDSADVDGATARTWLARHGQDLHRYGAAAPEQHP